MPDTHDLGCLLIEDPLYRIDALQGAAATLRQRGARAEAFCWDGGGALYPALQRAYQHIRSDDGINGIVALGAGCDCALALSCQLPVDRLALLEPMDWRATGEVAQQLRRIRSFARANAAFCVADVLIVPGPHTDDRQLHRLARGLNGARVVIAQAAEEMWSNRKEVLNLGIFHFLRDGVLPKSLAENPEMCIIYG